jgi:hypothetical protein
MNSDVHAPPSRWPNVPACYGWLALNARGHWRLGEEGAEIVHHRVLIDFLNRNYAMTERGEWFVQNGPQRVFVKVIRAPYIVRLNETGEWQTHTGLVVRQIIEALADTEGNAYMVCEHGLAGIDDLDLLSLLSTNEADDDVSAVILNNRQLPLVCVDANTLPARFGFVSQPYAMAIRSKTADDSSKQRKPTAAVAPKNHALIHFHALFAEFSDIVNRLFEIRFGNIERRSLAILLDKRSNPDAENRSDNDIGVDDQSPISHGARLASVGNLRPTHLPKFPSVRTLPAFADQPTGMHLAPTAPGFRYWNVKPDGLPVTGDLNRHH